MLRYREFDLQYRQHWFINHWIVEQMSLTLVPFCGCMCGCPSQRPTSPSQMKQICAHDKINIPHPQSHKTNDYGLSPDKLGLLPRCHPYLHCGSCQGCYSSVDVVLVSKDIITSAFFNMLLYMAALSTDQSIGVHLVHSVDIDFSIWAGLAPGTEVLN